MAPNITWLGHASFRIEGDDKVIYIDPWQIEVGPEADLILITHDHHDHCSPDDVSRIQKDDTVIITIPAAAKKLSGTIRKVAPGDKINEQGIKISVVPAYNTNKYRNPGEHFHPRESNYVGFILTVEGERIYHSGDTDVIPEMKSIETDTALLPVSGIYVMTPDEAAEAAEIIKPEKIIPMHVGRGIGNLEDRDLFKEKVSIKVEIPSL
ncbi:MAG: MBL fold metallo-hydrolase [Deltaproteobacteria bacterium]|nr:MBL fold metallo-hydrolase [Deltaproteobacteria bacterium]